MTDPFQLRSAAEGDAPELTRLDGEIFPGAGDSLQSWQNEIANTAARVILFILADRPVAFVSAFLAGNDLEIRKIGVLAGFRRRGIAKQLIHDTLRRYPAERCLIDVSDTNVHGIAFYQNLGFTELARRKKYYRDGSNAIVMELRKRGADTAS